jgi:hypothetical protein
MSVPYLGNVLKGWMEKISVAIFTGQTVVNGETVDGTDPQILNMNLQPMPSMQVARKPEGDRAWDWWNIIIKDGPYLKKGTVFSIDRDSVTETYRIEKANDWRKSGFSKYEAIKDYQDVST